MPGTKKKSNAKAKVKADVKKVEHEMKVAGKDVEKAVEKGAHDLKRAGGKVKKKI